MSRAARPATVWLVAVLLVASVSAAWARGGRGGGGVGGGGQVGGGFSGRGPASGGSFGQRGGGGGFNGRGPAASGSFPGRASESGGPYAGGAAAGQRDTSAIAQQRREQLSGLRGPGGREAGQARENWQDYSNDYHGRGDYGSGYDENDYGYAGMAAAAAVGAAVGAAAATPPYWTLPCAPTPVAVGGTTYYQCGYAWYIQAYSGGDVAYVITTPPVGY